MHLSELPPLRVCATEEGLVRRSGAKAYRAFFFLFRAVVIDWYPRTLTPLTYGIWKSPSIRMSLRHSAVRYVGQAFATITFYGPESGR